VIVEFQYFDGCPNSSETLNNLYQLVSEGLLRKEQIRVVKVTDSGHAERIKFQGSPTVLLDGMDLYSGKKPETTSYSCRIYEINGRKSGILPTDYLRSKIETASAKKELP
jgi:hypothetical protein